MKENINKSGNVNIIINTNKNRDLEIYAKMYTSSIEVKEIKEILNL